MLGRTLDHYRIEAKLGEGGMGVVYQARDLHLDRLVAIKVLPHDRLADPARKQRFAQEARAASALNHPNIVTIHDIRSQDGVDFIVMEYVEGRTLDALVRPRALPPAQALPLAVQIADALAKAHAAGILHRDLKPSNLMVTAEGRVKILDFGLAKLLDAADSTPEGSTLTGRPLTEEGVVVGTAAYMSPEQAEGRPLDARSDIFSFGTILYEMTTGRRPFTGDSWLSILSRIVSEDPRPPAEISAAIPVELEKIILRCLRKTPARRYQSMADLKVALEDLAAESESARKTPAPRRRWVSVAILPVLLLAGYLAWRFARGPESAEPLAAIPLSTRPGVHRYPTFSPDGNHIAFTWHGSKNDNPDIYVQQIGSAGEPLRLTNDPGDDHSPVWSPDGKWIAFLRRRWESRSNEVRLVPPLGGPERKIAEILMMNPSVWAPYMTWCADSSCLVASHTPGEGKPPALFVVSLDGEKRQLTDPQPPSAGDTNPSISPDGSALIFRRNASGPFTGQLFHLALGEGMTAAAEPRRITPPNLDAGAPAWMPDGREILFSLGHGGLRRLALTGGDPDRSAPARLPYVGENGQMPVVSRPLPGRPPRLAYIRVLRDFNFWRVETPAPGAAATSPPVASALSSTKEDYHPDFSPDGRRVAFGSARVGDSEIWVAAPDGSNAVRLTTGATGSGFPRWSPDGERILYLASPEGQWEVYVVPAAGGRPRNVTSHPSMDAWATFSADGKWIYFTSDRSGGFQLWKVPSSGGEALQLTRNGAILPRESPDGAWIYYNQSMDKPSPLWRVPPAGGEPEKVLDGVVLANFAVRSDGIYYIDRPTGPGGSFFIDPTGGETRLQHFDLKTRRTTTVARNLGNVFIGLTISPDARTILYTRLDSSIDDLMLVENFR
jgi:serine/threonine protein kinase